MDDAIEGTPDRAVDAPPIGARLPLRPGEMPQRYGDTAAVLVVDDDPDIGMLVERILGRAGYRCTVAAGVGEARRSIGRRPFAVAVVDAGLPDEAGLQLIEDLLGGSHDTAVVMLTGLDHPRLTERIVGLGLSGHLVKPFTADQLLVTVANAGVRRCLEIDLRQHGRVERIADVMVPRAAPVADLGSTTSDDGATYRALVEAAPDAIVAVDVDGRIALVNAQAERLFGYARAELLGNTVDVLVPDGFRGVHPERRSRYVADPRPRPMGAGMELAGRRRDGSEFPAEISLSAIRTEGGLLVSAAIRDVTDRKQAEAKFRGLLEGAPDAIVGVNRDGRIALANAQAERLFGYSRDELVGQPVEILVPDAARAVHPERRAGYFGSPKSRPMGAGMQLAGRRKDGSEFPAEISLSSLQTEDGLLVSAAVRDVTDRIEALAERERLRAEAERERYERRLHQSQRLESLGQLAGGVAHDFNNLLAVILNYTSFIGEELAAAAAMPDGDRWAQVGSDVAQVEKAAKRAAGLTHQLLAFGRRELVQPEVVDLNQVIRDVKELLQRSTGEHVEIVDDLDGELRPVFADAGQLEQVLLNLAVNARDAMPSGGVLRIGTRNRTIGADDASELPGLDVGDHVELRVGDTGHGMPESVRTRVFEPFFTTKPTGQGSGLGLATVYGIVAQAGGVVDVTSSPGVGTTFTVLLPATTRARGRSERDPGADPRRGGETVLVVEDEEGLRDVTRRILEKHGYTVLVADGGEQALDVLGTQGHRVDVVLTDVIMPRMLGKELGERVGALHPGTKILYMSGYAEPVLTSQGTLPQGVTLVQKPFDSASLLAKLREVLDATTSGD